MLVCGNYFVSYLVVTKEFVAQMQILKKHHLFSPQQTKNFQFISNRSLVANLYFILLFSLKSIHEMGQNKIKTPFQKHTEGMPLS